MAAINDLIQQIEDKNLRERLQQEVARLSKQKKFGLVFEEHIPECTPLYGIAIRKGSLVSVKGEDIRDVSFVSAISDKTAVIVNKATGEQREYPLESLVAVAQFGEPIFPSLVPIDHVENAPDNPLWHTLIEADNFHALQLLEYLYPKQVDCIYIDPPYNTGARDWKYNNDYVDAADNYRHSKWLSMMQRRLKIAKRLLNPENSVLIVTIDEKEYLHLGCLLEEMFPEARIQMVTIVTNPFGQERMRGLARVEEYAYFLFLGEAAPASLSDDFLNIREIKSMNMGRGEAAHEISPSTEKVRWEWLLRGGADALRQNNPGLFYPVYIDPIKRKVHSVGEPIPLNMHREEVTAPDGCIAVWPIKINGTEGRWRCSPAYLRSLLSKGYARIGEYDKVNDRWTLLYLSKVTMRRIESGEIEILGNAADGSVILGHVPAKEQLFSVKTVWNRGSHRAGEWGTRYIRTLLPGRVFSYPKSLYAVEDTLRIVTKEKPNALIVDFFAGSGTTLHAVNLLNAEDGGNRRCILVTNNEVSDDEAKALKKQGYQPGDEEWEKLGIARYITWPRTVCSIKGIDMNGTELKGNYGCEIEKMIEVDGEVTDPDTGRKLHGKFYKKVKEAMYPALSKIKLADGFAANAEYFKLGFLDRSNVALGQQFREILPLLWLKAGAVGKRPILTEGDLPDMLIPENSNFAILIDERYFGLFLTKIEERPNIEYVYLVTNSEDAYREMGARLRTRNVIQLYRDYLDNFVINSRRA